MRTLLVQTAEEWRQAQAEGEPCKIDRCTSCGASQKGHVKHKLLLSLGLKETCG